MLKFCQGPVLLGHTLPASIAGPKQCVPGPFALGVILRDCLLWLLCDISACRGYRSLVGAWGPKMPLLRRSTSDARQGGSANSLPSGKTDLLLRFFDSGHFDAWIALT